MRKFLSVVIVMTFLIGACFIASAEEKIGYIELSKVFDEYQKTKDSDKTLADKEGERQEKREKMVDEIKRLKDELSMMSKKGKEKKQEAIEKKIGALQDFDREIRTDLRRERDAMVRDILREIDKVVQEYGKKNGYTLILNDRVLLYREEKLNLTDDILKTLNNQYKRK